MDNENVNLVFTIEYKFYYFISVKAVMNVTKIFATTVKDRHIY